MVVVSLLSQKDPLSKMIAELGEESVPALAKSIIVAANTVKREWLKKLDSSTAKEGFKRAYKRSITVQGEGPLAASVSAEGMAVNFVETGIKRFDMKNPPSGKPGLLGGPNAKTNKKGEKYAVVMFRHGTPGTLTHPPMPRNVYNAMQNELRLKDASLNNRVKSVRSVLKTKEDIPDIYKGLTRLGSKGQRQYATFRVITKKSKGWIHPGVKKVPIFKSVVRDTKDKVKSIMQTGLEKDLADKLKGMISE